MLDTLKFVRGAVATKDLVPVLRHFRIAHGRIQGQNGRLCIDAPWTGPGMCAVVDAVKFLRAVDAADGEPTINEKEGFLSVSRGKFRARLAVLRVDDYPEVDVKDKTWSDSIDGSEEFMEAIWNLSPFMATDASRPWACSIYLSQGRAYATNNAVLAMADTPWWAGADLVLPDFFVNELSRINRVPQRLCWDEGAVCAFYDDGSWLWSRLIDGGWPAALRDVAGKVDANTEWQPTPTDLEDALAKLSPFFPDQKLPVVRTGEEGLTTVEGESSAAVDTGPLPSAAFRVESLRLVAACADEWNLEATPAPWRGPHLRGLLSKVVVGV